jgi:hypothetical protein
MKNMNRHVTESAEKEFKILFLGVFGGLAVKSPFFRLLICGH